MIKAIKYGFESAEKEYLENYAVHNNKLIDRSGSCALILLTMNNTLYVANVGDSRCVVSCANGKVVKDVTRDHKPNYPYEKERILKNGGSVYQTEIPIELEPEDADDDMFKDKVILGPYRVIPGRLSVSRTIGDAEAKVPIFGGNPKVIISEPDIFIYDLKRDDVDFFIMGCDGIYDQLSSKEVIDCAWMVLNEPDIINNSLNMKCGNIVDLILKMSMIRKSYDNVTCLIIALKEVEDLRNSKSKKDIVLNCYNEIKFYNKISSNNPVFKINKNTEKTLFMNKNKLPTLQLMNRNRNNMKFKKLFKNNNYFSNYLSKLSITNVNNNTNRVNKREENDIHNLRNASVPSHQNKNALNANSITLLKNDFQNIQRNKNVYTSPTNTNSKKTLDNMTVNLTEPNITNNLRINLTTKSKSIFTNSTKNNRVDFLYLNKNSSQGAIDEANTNNDSLIQKKSIPINSVTPTSIRIKNKPMLPRDYALDSKSHAKYHSVNKKNSIMIDPNLIHKNENQINYNNKIYGIRFKNVDEKLPLYQKAFKGTLVSSRKKDLYSHILDRNKNNLSLKNNKINMINLENMSNIIQNENANNLLEKKNFYPSIEDSHRNNNNIKLKKPTKLKLDFLNSIQINKNHSISASKYSVTDINSQPKMPLIIQQKKNKHKSNKYINDIL
jgi:serine/threonine protein phosphatase PrpC